MRVVDTEFVLELEPSKGRTVGLHQSDVVRQIALDMKYLAPEYADAELDPNKISLGLAWEEWVVNKHPEMAAHPGEKSKDGVIVSVDGISYEDIPLLSVKGKPLGSTVEMPVVHEVKCTWYSMPKTLEALIEDDKFWMYRAQMMNGCAVWNTRFAKLHPFFVNGDYGWLRGKAATSVSTIYKVYEFEFTQAEINGNWAMILQYVKKHPELFQYPKEQGNEKSKSKKAVR